MTRRLAGVVALAAEMLVAEDVLGQTFAGRAGSTTFELTYPRLPADPQEDNVDFLKAPPGAEELVARMVGTGVDGWGYTPFTKAMPGAARRSYASYVHRVAIRLADDVADDIAPFDLADDFGGRFDAWYSLALDWTELLTGVVVSSDHPWQPRSRGEVRDIDQPAPDGLTGWGVHLGSVTILGSAQATDRATLTAAFSKASAGVHPPLAWQLFLRSQRAADPRIAVIELATAAEVCMTGALASRLSSVTESARELIVKQANGLVGLVGLLEQLDGTAKADSLVNRVAHRLAGLRNLAAHQGAPPADASELVEAEQAARAVIDRYSPLPP